MRKVLESEARTVPDAVEIALKRLGVPKEQLKIEVLEEGFQNAMGFRLARVRVTHDPQAQTAPSPAAASIPQASPLPPIAPPVQAAPAVAPPRKPLTPILPAPPASPPKPKPAPAPVVHEEEDEEFEEDDLVEVEDDDLVEVDDVVEDDDVVEAGPEIDPLEEACDLVSEILIRIGIESKVKANQDGDKLRLFIESEDGSLLIGKNGKNIDALQHIVNRILSKGSKERSIVVLDTEDYRRRRQDSLESLAFRAADRVKDTGRKVILQEMNPYDRRLIHLALKDDPDVQTESEGDGFLKRITIFPAYKNKSRGRR